MMSKFSLNQKVAIITEFFAAIWAIISLFIAYDMGLQSIYALAIFGIMTILAWLLIPLYFRRVKIGYIIGIILLFIGLIGLFASPGNPAWYTFTNPISIVKETTFVIDSILGIFFSYKSYKEL